jgi:phosphate-selective porin
MLLCLLSMAFAAPLRAAETDRVDRLLELLVTKGVITSDEAAELKVAVAEPAAASPAPANAIGTKTDISANGYLKVQSNWNDNGTTQNNDTFSIRHARFTFAGAPAPDYSWKMGVALERTADPILLDASLQYKISPNRRVTAGQFKIPFSRESLQNGGSLDFMERARFIDQFRPPNGRDIGVMLTADMSKNWTAAIGAFNGNGKNTTDSNDQPMWAGRINGSLKAGRVVIEPEIAYIHARTEDGSTTRSAPQETSLLGTAGFGPYSKSEKQWGAAASFEDYELKYEYIMGRFKPRNTAITTVVADGHSLVLNKKLSRRAKLNLRHEKFDPNTATTTNGDIEWSTLGFTFQPHSQVTYKLNYVWKKEATASDNNDLLGLQMQLAF